MFSRGVILARVRLERPSTTVRLELQMPRDRLDGLDFSPEHNGAAWHGYTDFLVRADAFTCTGWPASAPPAARYPISWRDLRRRSNAGCGSLNKPETIRHPAFPPPPQTLPVMAHGHVSPDDTALNLLFLVLNLAAKEWRMRVKEWNAAKIQLAILFKDRFATN
jgi:hypothetical protein